MTSNDQSEVGNEFLTPKSI